MHTAGNAENGTGVEYQRHQPELTLLYQIIEKYGGQKGRTRLQVVYFYKEADKSTTLIESDPYYFGVVGIWGLLAVVFTNPDATLSAQLIGIANIFAWVYAASFVVWMVIKAVMGLRVSEEEEYEGTDLTECGLEAYPEFTGK